LPAGKHPDDVGDYLEGISGVRLTSEPSPAVARLVRADLGKKNASRYNAATIDTPPLTPVATWEFPLEQFMLARTNRMSTDSGRQSVGQRSMIA
jgi:hypothetical protein